MSPRIRRSINFCRWNFSARRGVGVGSNAAEGSKGQSGCNFQRLGFSTGRDNLPCEKDDIIRQVQTTG